MRIENKKKRTEPLNSDPVYVKVVLADVPKLRKTGFERFDPFVIHRAMQPEGVARH